MDIRIFVSAVAVLVPQCQGWIPEYAASNRPNFLLLGQPRTPWAHKEANSIWREPSSSSSSSPRPQRLGALFSTENKKGSAKGPKKGSKKEVNKEVEVVPDDADQMWADFTPEDDQQLLKHVTRDEMIDLCEDLGVAPTGSKIDMLKRLRAYVSEQARKQKGRVEARRRTVEDSGSDSRERHEVVNADEEEDEDEDSEYYYYTPESFTKFSARYPKQTDDLEDSVPEISKASEADSTPKANKTKGKKKGVGTSRNDVLAPPPPEEKNEDGERVVTVYSTDVQNDLTGVAASQPRTASQVDPMRSGVGEVENAPWDMKASQKGKKSPQEVDQAREKLVELVSNLLAMSGAPGFQGDGSDDEDLEAFGLLRQGTSSVKFEGFDPSKVETSTLAAASSALRTGRGRLFNEVVREFELRAVGYDGMAGDNPDKGGGHYREVIKVRSFLEGYRRAEVRSYARETATMLLDKLISEGVQGLDITLMSMSRNSDDGEFGELNDSLLDFLDDEVRKQERKVDQMVKKADETQSPPSIEQGDQDDITDKLWKVEMENGKRVETFDPRDPEIRDLMQDAMVENIKDPEPVRTEIPDTGPEKMLLVLKLLRDRVKTEAAFPNNEKSRNLRILSYCLRAEDREERKAQINAEFGKSFDRLDSFIELVSSSIEYGESTSHQLQPSKKGSLNVRLLKQIRDCAKEVKEELKRKTGTSHLMP